MQLIATGAISGRIVSQSGDPVVAYVEAMQYSYPPRGDSPPGTVFNALPTDGHRPLESRAGTQ